MNNFEKIYKENYNTIYCVAKKMVNDGDVVADIIQDVFTFFYDKTNNNHSIHHPKSWLYRATFNKCIDHLNRQKRYLALEAIDEQTTVDHSVENQELKSVINKALAKLKPTEKLLAILYSEGFSYKEIAETTDIKFTSIGKMLSRTLKKLEKELKKQCYEVY